MVRADYEVTRKPLMRVERACRAAGLASTVLLVYLSLKLGTLWNYVQLRFVSVAMRRGRARDGWQTLLPGGTGSRADSRLRGESSTHMAQAVQCYQDSRPSLGIPFFSSGNYDRGLRRNDGREP